MWSLLQKAVENKFKSKYQLVNIPHSFHIVPSMQLPSNNAKAIEEWSVDYGAGQLKMPHCRQGSVSLFASLPAK